LGLGSLKADSNVRVGERGVEKKWREEEMELITVEKEENDILFSVLAWTRVERLNGISVPFFKKSVVRYGNKDCKVAS